MKLWRVRLPEDKYWQTWQGTDEDADRWREQGLIVIPT